MMYKFKKYNLNRESIKRSLGIFLLSIVTCSIIYIIFHYSHILGLVFVLFTLTYVGLELIGAFNNSTYDWIFRLFALVSGYVLLPLNIVVYKITNNSDFFYLILLFSLFLWVISLICIIVNRK